MALITRLTRILSADFHAVLDKLEEPEVLLKQAIREMEQDLETREQAIKEMHNQRKRLEAQSTRATKDLEKLTQELDLCFDAGNDSLARSLIRRKLEAEGFIANATSLHSSLTENLDLQQAQFREDQLHLASLRQQAEVFSVKDNVTTHDWNSDGTTISEDDIDVTFLKEKHKRAQIRGERS